MCAGGCCLEADLSPEVHCDAHAGDDEPQASGRKRKKKGLASSGGMRKTRGMLAEKSKGPKTFRDWLDEVLPRGSRGVCVWWCGRPW